ncbi:hypothetical protein [uncultured Psychroserpens sp.]|uniref:hypothetical protein n=1 Tax=uncultured Psychroserpens sp. TaxID=255436 RepID=UPI0026265C00|nr:hypothetical protein [uncultured Psychroserpens sp.]
MKVINIHKRKIRASQDNVSALFRTLATSNDLIWPIDKWPAIRFKNGLKIGSKGGHGRIRYTIVEFDECTHIKFEFTKPDGFYGTHALNIKAISENECEISHVINARTSLKASFYWLFIIKWLHNALIEDAFDKVENYVSEVQKVSQHSLWVQMLREFYKSKSFQTKHA